MKFAVENYKIFKERTEFDLRPFTILVGPNGSGKSTMLESLQLLGSMYSGSFLTEYYELDQAIDDIYNLNVNKYSGKEISKDILTKRSGKNDLVLTISNDKFLLEILYSFDADKDRPYRIEQPRSDREKDKFKFINASIKDLHGEKVALIETDYRIFINPKKFEIDRSLIGDTDTIFKIANIEPFIKTNEELDENWFEELECKMTDDFFSEELVMVKPGNASRSIQDWDYAYCDFFLNQRFYNPRIDDRDYMGYLFNIPRAELVNNEIKISIQSKVDSALNDLRVILNDLLLETKGFNYCTHKRSVNKLVLSCEDVDRNSDEINKLVSFLIKGKNFKEKTEIACNLFNKIINKNFKSKVIENKDDVSCAIIFIEDKKEYHLKDMSYGMISAFIVCLYLSLVNKEIGSALDHRIYFREPSEAELEENPGIPPGAYMASHISTVMIAEPEMNLHPSAQSRMASVFLEVYKNHGTNFILETHSEYLIRHFQYLVAKGELKKEDIQMYYFNDPDKLQEGDEVVYAINIENGGSLTRPFGPGFFDEADKNALELLLLNKTQQN